MKLGPKNPKRTFFKVFALKPGAAFPVDKPDSFDWQDNTLAELIYDKWFPDIPDIIQEPGETEDTAVDLYLNKNIKII
jgi:hypothetical protein